MFTSNVQNIQRFDCIFNGFVCLTCLVFLFSSQKSFSLVLEALDYDNDTSESGKVLNYVKNQVSLLSHYPTLLFEDKGA